MKNLIEELGILIERIETNMQKEKPSEVEATIGALRDTDYRDKDAFFKMAELLKGLAVASEEDEKAREFLSAVSDALTTAAKSVLGESIEEARGRKDVSKAFSKYFDRIEINMMAIPKLYRDIEKLLDSGDDVDAGMRALIKKYRD